ncbi:cytochrome ubiquinol oxidase subunit II [Palleronia sediminis]|uniref:cytochrome ubiquinol oxidase subunit II n=1 Tax=Palleronia sediminis TaxID=2547833 RepID=UPI00197FE8FC|nr:cytochrome ubiquinol oxidase subunit II [Palleronia sediminis]
MARPFATARFLPICVLALAMLAFPAAAQEVGAEARGFLRPLGPIAELQRTELIWASVLISIAILPVLIGVPVILWRYRRRNTRARYAPDWSFDTRLEIVMWVVPALIVIALSVWLTQAVIRIDPYREIDAAMADEMGFEIEGPPVRVDVVGLDWKWLFLYPEEGIASVGEMIVPVGHPVRMRITSDTVMQSFMASGLAGQIYAMAGMETRLNLIADEPGVTLAQNTQYNGPHFPSQRAPVRAVPVAEFDAWADDARRAGVTLDAESYAALAVAGTVDDARERLGLDGAGPIQLRLDDAFLFDRVVGRYRTGEPVPRDAQPGSPAYTPDATFLPEMANLLPGALCGPGDGRPVERVAGLSLSARLAALDLSLPDEETRP